MGLIASALGQQGLGKAQTPMAQIARLITELEAKVQEDGKAEGASYDKYACWCESTMSVIYGCLVFASTFDIFVLVMASARGSRRRDP